MQKRKKNNLPLNEESLKRETRENEIIDPKPKTKHPHQKQISVGEDERSYLTEELREQGYTEEGMITRKPVREEEPNPHSRQARKIA